ncbi:MAG: transketolase [Anaerolineaceae bacterium]
MACERPARHDGRTGRRPNPEELAALATETTELDQLCINTIRTLAIDSVQKANSGHAGAPMGAAPMAYALWSRFLKHNPANPAWADRDRFILSAGHASLLLYSLLALTGYELQLAELEQFRQWSSRTPGHPESLETPGVEITTGPLGAGFSMGVGMALAERHLGAQFNKPGHTIVDHYTYGICSDGDLMEGVASEAASLAGTWGLGKLIYLYDDNGITIEGETSLAFTEDVGKRFEAYGWHVTPVDGNDMADVLAGLERARKEQRRPSLIMAKTTIGYGSPHKAGTAEAHSNPLGEEEVRLTKLALDWPSDSSFFVPEEALAEFRKAGPRGKQAEADWLVRLAAYTDAYPVEAALLQRVQAGELPEQWQLSVPSFSSADGAMATRAASGKVLNAIAATLSELVGGSADLAPSNNTHLNGYGDIGANEASGRNIHFGVREHAMGNIVSGMAMHGGLIPYSGTFLVFSDYMRPAIRLAAIMKAHAVFVFTHDSIGVGEDGPTHQPIEHLSSLRAMPGLCVIRPADANETAAAWKLAIEGAGPTALILTRQNLPTMDDAQTIEAGTRRGAYILADAEGTPDVVLLATGSEVEVALGARTLLAAEGIQARVVSMPCWEIFDAQPEDYRRGVIPPAVRARVSVEAGVSHGWHRYTGDYGEQVSIEHFGASAPAPILFEKFGFTPQNVVTKAKESIRRSGG